MGAKGKFWNASATRMCARVCVYIFSDILHYTHYYYAAGCVYSAPFGIWESWMAHTHTHTMEMVGELWVGCSVESLNKRKATATHLVRAVAEHLLM